MKRLIRRPWVQAALSWVLWLELVVTRRTLRWRHENVECAAPVLKDGVPCIILFWHGRIPLALGMAQVFWVRDKLRCLVSPSHDGEFVAQALARAKFPAVRMSSAKKGDASKARAAVAGFREALAWVKNGGLLAITPDGPRGPNEVIAPGAIQIAKRSGAPIYLIGTAAWPAKQFDTWDKVMLPRPFGRGVTVWDGPFQVPSDVDEAGIERLVEQLSSRLSGLTRQAEDLACGRGDEK